MRSMVAAFILISAASASAQSLADIARQEEARRKAVAGAGKVYTNEALQPEPPPSPGSVPAATPAPAAPATPGADAAKPADPAAPGGAAKTEAEWKKRIADARDALSRAQIFAEALQSRINVLSADFVNVDDPAQRTVVGSERDKALAELNRVKQEIQTHQKMITAIQDEARKAGVPAGWVR
jgi:hypothetical protein